MWYDKWFGDWFGGWYDNSEGDEETVDLFGGITPREEVIGGSSVRYSYIEEDDLESEILAICNAFLICH